MKLRFLDDVFCVCKLDDASELSLSGMPCFLARTETETSFVCPTRSVPSNAVRVEDGWKCFTVPEKLEFSQIGIMADIGGVLAEAGISVLALSTFDTDYFLVRRDGADRAREALEEAGYEFV